MTFGFQPWSGSEGVSFVVPSAVLMIFTSPVAGAVSVAGAIGGFVITGLGAAVLVVVRRVRFFFIAYSALAKLRWFISVVL